jgi:hypothetical protein
MVSGFATCDAFEIVLNGADCVPALESEPVVAT